MFFVILVEDVYCVAIHDLAPVLTALFSIELGGFNSQHSGCCRQSTHSLLEVVAVSQHKFEEVDKSLDVGDDGLLCCVLCLRDFGAALEIDEDQEDIVWIWYCSVVLQKCYVWFGKLAHRLI